MTITGEMIRPARAGDCDAGKIGSFIRSRRQADGGFSGRGSDSELYYTQFALLCARAIGLEDIPPSTAGYLDRFGDGESLGLVDLCCLIRCLSLAGQEGPVVLLDRIGTFRSPDGGFSPARGDHRGTVYGCFMAAGAIEDCGGLNDPEALINCVESLRCSGGGYANDSSTAIPTTPATSAALVLTSHMDLPCDEQSMAWLEDRFCEEGGFAATSIAPVPDLLSTAVSLHALGLCGRGPDAARNDRCREYVASMERADGGYAGSRDDHEADVEYTFYGMLSLGHLEREHG